MSTILKLLCVVLTKKDIRHNLKFLIKRKCQKQGQRISNARKKSKICLPFNLRLKNLASTRLQRCLASLALSGNLSICIGISAAWFTFLFLSLSLSGASLCVCVCACLWRSYTVVHLEMIRRKIVLLLRLPPRPARGSVCAWLWLAEINLYIKMIRPERVGGGGGERRWGGEEENFEDGASKTDARDSSCISGGTRRQHTWLFRNFGPAGNVYSEVTCLGNMGTHDGHSASLKACMVSKHFGGKFIAGGSSLARVVSFKCV